MFSRRASRSTATSPPASRRRILRPSFVLGTNLVLATAVFGWVLVRFGGPAIHVLRRAPSLRLLWAFAIALAVGLLLEAWRWAILLRGLGGAAPLWTLLAYRAAGHTIASIVPSARLGGEPLRAYLLVRESVPVPDAVASVGVDRSIEMGVGAPLAALFGVVLLQHGVPQLGSAVVTLAAVALAVVGAVVVTIGRLRRGAGLVSTLAMSTGLHRLKVVADRMETVREAEREAGRLARQDGRLHAAVALSLVAVGFVCLEYRLLLAAFDLPAEPIAVVAAIFATGAARSLPVPGGVGVLEGAQMWTFGMLGHDPSVGLAVGLAVRLRELGWTLPGAAYLMARGLTGIATASGEE